MAQSFKTLIFLTIPLSIFVMVLVCTSFATEHWVEGQSINGSDPDLKVEFNFGLFAGFKTRTLKGTNKFTLKSKNNFYLLN